MAGTVSKGASGARSDTARAGGQTGRGSGSQGRSGGDGPRGGLQNAGARTVGGSGLADGRGFGGPNSRLAAGSGLSMTGLNTAIDSLDISKDLANRNNTLGEDFANLFASGLGVREYGPSRTMLGGMLAGGVTPARTGSWGFDPAGLIGSAAGSAVGMPYGGGYLGTTISDALQNPLMMNVKGPRYGRDTQTASLMGPFGARLGLDGGRDSGARQPSSMTPGFSGGSQGFGRSRQGGNSGQNRRTLTVPGYISGLLS